MPDQQKPHWTTLSLILFIIGLLILIPSGLCTGIFGLGFLFGGDSTWQGGGGLAMLAMVFAVGAPVMLLGAALIAAALGLRKRN